MREEVKRWINLAKEDFESAKINFDNAKFYVCAFLCQQAVEKALKAWLIEKTGKFPKIHDLVFLAEKLNLDKHLVKGCDELSKVYIETRYPDIEEKLPYEKFDKNKTKRFLYISEELLKWIEKKI